MFDPSDRHFHAEGLGEIPIRDAVGTAISIRPHALTVATARDGTRTWFDGEVEESEFLGEFTRYGVRVGPTLLTADTPHLSSTPVFGPGTKVQIGIDPAEIRVLR